MHTGKWVNFSPTLLVEVKVATHALSLTSTCLDAQHMRKQFAKICFVALPERGLY